MSVTERLTAVQSTAISNEQFITLTRHETINIITEKVLEIFFASSDGLQNDLPFLKERAKNSFNLIKGVDLKDNSSQQSALTKLISLMANLSNPNFFEAYSTTNDPTSVLRPSAKKLFWIILMGTYVNLDELKAFASIKLSCHVMKQTHKHVAVVSQVALPIVLEAVKSLDTFDSDMLDQSTSNDGAPNSIPPVVQNFFRKFDIDLT